MPCNQAKSKARVHHSKGKGEADREIAADVGTTGSRNVAEETVGTREVNEPVTEGLMSLQTTGSVVDDGDAKVTTAQELGALNAEPHSEINCAKASRKRTPYSRRQQSQVEPAAAGPEQKCIASQLRKKNGIVLETRNVSSLLSAVEPQDSQVQNEKPGNTEESSDFARTAAMSAGHRHYAPTVNGFRRSTSVMTRRRSTLKENSQTLNIAANKLETTVSATTVDTVTALLEELSDSKELDLMNGKGLVIDGNC